jgi:hypothetical protein
MTSTVSNLITIGSAVIGIASFAWAIYESKRSKRISDYLRAFTQGYPGSVAKIEQNCTFATANIGDAFDAVNKMPDTEDKRNALRFLQLASSDSKSSAQICHTLFNQLLSNQEAQFGTRRVTYADKEPLDLIVAERTRAEQNQQ